AVPERRTRRGTAVSRRYGAPERATGAFRRRRLPSAPRIGRAGARAGRCARGRSRQYVHRGARRERRRGEALVGSTLPGVTLPGIALTGITLPGSAGAIPRRLRVGPGNLPLEVTTYVPGQRGHPGGRRFQFG